MLDRPVGRRRSVGLVWQLAGRSEFDAWTFPWGLLWVDLLSLVLVAAAVAPRTVLSRGPWHATPRGDRPSLLLPVPLALAGHRVPASRRATCPLDGLADPRRLRRAHRCADRGVVPLRRAALPDRPARARRSPSASWPRGGRPAAWPGASPSASALVVAAVVAVALTGPSTTDESLTSPVSRVARRHRGNGLARDGDHVGLGHHDATGDRADAGQRRAGHHRSPVHRDDRALSSPPARSRSA